ncbi:hypothetical protein [Dulcicalothrix desertica]|uniref:hypothetical protein n=1 Tax=Dulcicalothrix desertica TaxID=32056 RepID=UPI001F184731|nr:hypothetical protein [Dulcicalothrix desertica]
MQSKNLQLRALFLSPNVQRALNMLGSVPPANLRLSVTSVTSVANTHLLIAKNVLY